MNPGTARYTTPAIVLHWLLAVLIAGAFGLGLYMVDLPNSPDKLKTYNWHKWAGATILALTLLRLAWRATHRPPPALALPAWQQRVAAAVQAAMYVLFFVVPLVGWAYSSALGYPLVWFGVLALPDWVPVERELARAIKPWHERTAWMLAALVLLHAAAALHHHLVRRDDTLHRIAPWLRRHGP